MGKGGEAHEEAIAFIERNHPRGEREYSLRHIYKDEWESRWRKERPLTADYFINEPGLKALVEVSINDEWRTLYGKAMIFLYEAEQIDTNCEAWIVTNCTKRADGIRQKGWDLAKKRDYLQAGFKDAKQLALSVLHERLRNRLRYWDFDGKELKEF